MIKKWPSTVLVWQKWVATVGGVGLMRFAPGTWGAAAGAILLLPFWKMPGLDLLPYLCFATIFFSILGAKAAHDLAPDWGEDPSPIVLDEVVGMWVALWGLEVNMPHLVAAFFLFRFFDIFKPFGIRRLENVKNGWGVMLDDLAAGAVSNLLIWAAKFFLGGTALF